MHAPSFYPTLYPVYQLIHDKPFLPEKEQLERLRFHIETGDYLAMVAQALGFVEEKLEECGRGKEASDSSELFLVRRLRSDLRHAHKHFTISERAPLNGNDVADV